MSLILTWTLEIWLLITTKLSVTNLLHEEIIKNNLVHITQHQNISKNKKTHIIKILQSTLCVISEKKNSATNIQKNHNIINNLSYIKLHMYGGKKYNINQVININNIKHFSNKLKKHLLYTNQQLTISKQESQKEKNQLQSIYNPSILITEQYTKIKTTCDIITQKILSIFPQKRLTNHFNNPKNTKLKIKQIITKIQTTELKIAPLNTNSHQKLSTLPIQFLTNLYFNVKQKIQTLQIQTNNIQQNNTTQKIEHIKKSTKQNNKSPICNIQQIQKTDNLSFKLTTQTNKIQQIILQQQKITTQVLQIQETLNKLLKQTQKINKYPELGIAFRTQITKLSKLNNIPKPQEIDHEIIQIQKEKLQYKQEIGKLSHTLLQYTRNQKHPLTCKQQKTLNTQINTQEQLLNTLLINCDTQILELTNLKITYQQFKNIIYKTQKTIQHHLLWIADIEPINLTFPYILYQDLYELLTTNITRQILSALKICILNTKTTITINFLPILLLCSHIVICQQYSTFLKKHKNKKNNQNNHTLNTIQNITWSILIAIPIPIIWKIIGCTLSEESTYPFAASIGHGMIFTTPILFLLITIAQFSKINGLFIIHFKWNKQIIYQARHYYILHSSVLISLIVILITFNNYQDQKFYNTFSRLSFIVLCTYLTLIFKKLKKINVALYINHNNSYNNMINQTLWNIMIYTPIIGIIISCLGYLTTAQILLAHIAISFTIWIFSSIAYYAIHNWITTKKYHIQNKLIQQKTTPLITKNHLFNKKNNLSQNETNNQSLNINNIHSKIIKRIINLKNNLYTEQSNYQLLQLTRYLIIFSTILLIIFLCPELRSLFISLKNITLWNITSTIQGVNNIQPITLEIIFTSILIIFITNKTIQNLSTLLHITILQHVNLSPNTNYAIQTLTKYIIILLSIIIICSLIGIEWSKLQWLIAAISVGLGFGLQEIFANFISGLIILFEKPIRIGDTITIHELTGNITHINTRATTITDWDHKEIIIPNKEFITKKFINWSLSDTITRVVLKVPAPSEGNLEKITKILLQAAKNCPLVLHNPKTEVYLIDIQNGIPLFEMRMYAANMNHRMPLRHQVHILVIQYYKQYGLKLPFPHIQINKDKNNTTNTNKHT